MRAGTIASRVCCYYNNICSALCVCCYVKAKFMTYQISMKPHSQDRWEAIKGLILLFQKRYGLQSQDIAKAVSRNRSTFSTEMSKPATNREAERRLYNIYGKWLLAEARSRAPLPRFFRSLFDEVLTEEAANEICPPSRSDTRYLDVKSGGHFDVVNDELCRNRNSGYEVDCSLMRSDPNGFPRLTGLSILVRPSNQAINIAEPGHPRNLQYGVSISLLNLIPEHIQTGRYHPLFKLRQKSAERNVIDIEGVVLVQDDRIILSGREEGQKRNMLASISFRREAAELFRDPENGKKSEAIMGMMLGVSNSRSHFGSLFTIFALPGGFVSREDAKDPKVMERFQAIYDAGRAAAGVYSEDDVYQKLQELGISDHGDDIRYLLHRDLRNNTLHF